jgi:hypothetical protein
MTAPNPTRPSELARVRRRTLGPIASIFRSRLLRREPRSLASVAARSWEIAPSSTSIVTRAFFLPGQLDRITGWTFTNGHPRDEMQGGTSGTNAPTRGFLLEDAWLIDGVLYKADAVSHLHPRSSRWLRSTAENEVQRGALYCTPGGNRYFGMWLVDDCVTYPLAAAEGTPVTTAQRIGPHVPGYEAWLDMKPLRLASAFFRQLVVFEDFGHNPDKGARFRAMNAKLNRRVEAKPHPGVFLWRGQTGTRRVLRNEQEVAELLRDRRGLRIIDATKADVPTIVAACAGARLVVGVEGSNLMHGIVGLLPGGALLALQPPNRFVSMCKHLTDRDGQHFGFVVGIPDGGDFRIDPVEVERTLDLFPPLDGS